MAAKPPISSIQRRAASVRRATALMLCYAAALPASAANKTWNWSFGDWSQASGWSPNGVPLAGDHVYVGFNPEYTQPYLYLDQNATIAALDLAQYANVSTEGYRLTVSGQTLIDGIHEFSIPEAYAILRVENGPSAVDYSTGTLVLADSGGLRLVGATMSTTGVFAMQTDSWVGGHGTINVGGNASIGGEWGVFGGLLTMNVAGGTIDLDGAAGLGQIVINDPIADLTITAGGVTDAFDSYLFVGPGSDFTLNAPGGWSVGPNGLLQSGSWASSGYVSRILGSPLTLAGRLVAQEGFSEPTINTVRLGCATTFQPSATVGAHTSILEVDGNATILGGTFEMDEGGRISFNAPTTVSGGLFTLADGADLVFESTTTVTGGDFQTFSNSSAAGAVRFGGPTTFNGVIDIDGAARQLGTATISGATTINAGMIDMDGGGATTWNVGNSLVVNAESIEAGPGNTFDGVLNISGGFIGRLTLNLADPNLAWTMAGSMVLTGDATLFVTRLAGSDVRVTGDLTLASGRTRVDSNTEFTDSAVVGFNAPSAILRLHGVTHVGAGTTFNGAGTLQNAGSGTMTFADGASTDGVRLVNDGHLQLADGPGIVAVDRFQNSANGTWQVEIGGHTVGSQHDALIVSPGQAQLAGALEISTIGGFDPQIGDEFVILTALGGVSGSFDNNPISCADGVHYLWTVLYGANDVRLRLDSINSSSPGDMNCDCRVDFFDIDPLVEAFSHPGGGGWPYDCPWLNGDCDGDGDVDFFDIDPFVALLGS